MKLFKRTTLSAHRAVQFKGGMQETDWSGSVTISPSDNQWSDM